MGTVCSCVRILCEYQNEIMIPLGTRLSASLCAAKDYDIDNVKSSPHYLLRHFPFSFSSSLFFPFFFVSPYGKWRPENAISQNFVYLQRTNINIETENMHQYQPQLLSNPRGRQPVSATRRRQIWILHRHSCRSRPSERHRSRART